jgi:hypothetical protein
MNASVADILRGAGFAPVCPGSAPDGRDAETQAGSRVPVVPAVPDEKNKVEDETARTGNDDTVRARLLGLAEAEYRDPAIVHALTETDLRGFEAFPDDALKVALSMWADTAERKAGRVPAGDTAGIMCRKCGPVFVHPSIAAVLPVVDGWPRSLGCPWCFIHPAGIAIPRPHVTCHACQHYQPDAINPSNGWGACKANMPMRKGGWPHVERQCKAFEPAGVVIRGAP